MKRYLILASVLSVCAAPTRADEGPLGHEVIAKAFVEALKKGEFEKATKDFDATMKKESGADKLEELWKLLGVMYGSLKKTGALRTGKTGQYDLVFVPCEFEKGTLHTRVVFDAEGKVTGLSLRPFGPATEYKAPAYVKDIAKVQVYCAFAEVLLGEAGFSMPAK